MNVKRAINGLMRAAYIVPDRPTHAQFEVTNKCNLSCEMCPRTKYYKVKIMDMEYETFERVLDALLPLRLATLTGWGEPLLHPRIYDMVSLAKSKGVHAISLTSNALIFNDYHYEKLLTSGLTDIRISVDNFSETGDGTGHPGGAKSMEKVAELLSRRKGALPRIVLAVTIYPDNYQDVFTLIDKAAEIGMDGVAIMRMNDRFEETVKRYCYEEESHICAEYTARAKKAGIKIGTPREFSHGIRRILYRGGTKCPMTFDNVYVTAEGLITPCCALPKFVTGDPAQCDIKTIWKNEKFRKFRIEQRDVCSHCDLLDITYKNR